MNQTPLPGCLYQAIPGFEDHLLAELGNPNLKPLFPGTLLFHDDSCHNSGSLKKVFWHQNCWKKPFRLEFTSISQAASELRAVQRNWAACLYTNFRRGALISSKLPHVSAKKRSFPRLLPNSQMGAWTLLGENTMIASALCSSPFPGGVIEFIEDKEGPPSRAYLKLWEALVRMRKWPQPGERCLDAGASPGGWTWALAKLGAEVIAVDRSPLEDRIGSLPHITFIRHDAFTLKPEEIGPIDWLFCDVACYPQRLFGWIEKWLNSGLCQNFVCTIKMQGCAATIDFDTPRLFLEIPGSEIAHLYHNKHELTWMRLV